MFSLYLTSILYLSNVDSMRIDAVDICWNFGRIAYEASENKARGIPLSQYLAKQESKEFDNIIRASYTSNFGPRKTKLNMVSHCVASDMFKEIDYMN